MSSKDVYLFTLRIWREKRDDGQVEWRGRVQRVPQGPVHYFRSWAVLIDHLLNSLSGDAPELSDESSRVPIFPDATE